MGFSVNASIPTTADRAEPRLSSQAMEDPNAFSSGYGANNAALATSGGEYHVRAGPDDHLCGAMSTVTLCPASASAPPASAEATETSPCTLAMTVAPGTFVPSPASRLTARAVG